MKSISAKQLPYILIFIFAFILYGNTLTHQYALDDLIVIKENSFTKKGFSGIKEIFSYDSFTGFFGTDKKLVAGGRYRPLSIASFAVEYSLLGGLNPFFSHLVNILLYALTGCFIFLIISRIIKSPPGRPWYLGIAFISAMLFMAHPVHTEVVANIKGRDEIFALLFPLISAWLTLRFLDQKKPLLLAAANFCFFLGLLSKENAVMFAIITPLILYFFISIPIKKIITIAISFLFTALVFVFIRFLVLGYLNSGELPRELLNNPFLEASGSEKIGTIIYTLGLYVKLLFFPHPLTHDYYPYHISLVSLANWKSLLSLAVYLFLMVYVALKFKSKDIIAFGILFYLLTLFIVSNLLFPVGTFMNERFIYMPSLGFVLIIAYLVSDKLPKLVKEKTAYGNLATGLLIVILAIFTLRTYSRNRAWKDDFTLFTTDVQVSENSIKCNISAGGDYQKKAALETDPSKQAEDYEHAITYLEKALTIYPKAINGLVLYGNVLTLYKKDHKRAIEQYLKVLSLDPNNKNAYSNAIQVLGSIDYSKDSDYKLRILKYLYSLNPDNADVNYSLGKLYGQFRGNLDSASYFLERSVNLYSGSTAAFKDLGIVYSMKGEYAKALDIFSRALKIDPSDNQLRQNIQVTQQLMNQGKNGSGARR
ncbi:MAG: tetratricopeptide repeat protein [Bacteroidales bacterium]